jgi:hypothetical protein
VPTANGWVLTLIPYGTTPPSGAVAPNGTYDSSLSVGKCQLDCACRLETKNCTGCDGTTNCICDHCTGQCVHDAVCDVTFAPPPPGGCLACPVGDNGLECSGNGVCNCGTCVCSTTIQNAGGLACDSPTNGGQYTDCLSCTGNSYNWCNLAGVYACMPYADCVTLFGGIDTPCFTNPEQGCPNNCTCLEGNQNKTRGSCTESEGIFQCVCDKGRHGADCCATGASFNKAIAGIAGGVVAAIVIAGVVAFIVLGYGVKRGVDWVQLRNTNMAAAHDNPMFKAKTTEYDNAVYNKDSPRP